jgi:hypothetical protein
MEVIKVLHNTAAVAAPNTSKPHVHQRHKAIATSHPLGLKPTMNLSRFGNLYYGDLATIEQTIAKPH